MYTYIIIIVFIAGSILYKIISAHAGKALYIRKIAGLDSIDEAVGRATEMGRPVFYTPATGTYDISTISGITILSRIAKLSAKYNNRVVITTGDPVVYTMIEEICKEAYNAEGKAELFDPKRDLHFIMGQFPLAMGSAGIMQREKVAAAFFFGYYYAESLILAEAGNIAGAIQVAGTDAINQVPFFVTTCDYTIIGEELYAASAYISKQPTMLGSLVGQDYGKVLMTILVITGAIFATISGMIGYNWLIDIISR